MAFLYRIMGSDPDASEGENDRAEQLVSYLQRVFGCAATAKPEKLLFVLYGEGNNGKTTLLEVIRDALGDKEYARQVQVDSLMMRPKEAISNNAVNTDLADLQGCRFVSSSEVEQGQRLSRFFSTRQWFTFVPLPRSHLTLVFLLGLELHAHHHFP